MQHSIRIDSFSVEDELFFESHEAEPIDFEGALTLEFGAGEAQPATAEQLAHHTRFRKPVGWIVGAMGALSLLALGQHGSQQSSRLEIDAATGALRSVAAKNIAAVSPVPGRSVFASVAEQTSEAPWWGNDLALSAIALVLEPTPPSISGGKLSSRAESATRVSLVDDFSAALLSMCRNAPFESSHDWARVGSRETRRPG